MRHFSPDYTQIQKAALNKPTERLPLYEQHISHTVMEAVLGRTFRHLLGGGNWDKLEYFTALYEFYQKMGYVCISFEGSYTLAMPKEPLIKTYDDFLKYPWDEIPNLYFKMYGETFELMAEIMPGGMKAVGGVGDGVLEGVQTLVGNENLRHLSGSNPELYEHLIKKCTDTLYKIWERFLPLYGDAFCVLRSSDDFSHKNGALTPTEIRRLIEPLYKKIAALVHSYNKPFLFHSHGSIFDLMPDFIMNVKIDAIHANEEYIFSDWVKKYGKVIGNFGGIDADMLGQMPVTRIRKHVFTILNACAPLDGVAFGTSHAIPRSVPVDNYVAMVEAVRIYRGE